MEDKIKADLFNKYHQLKKDSGCQPSSTDFLRLPGINKRTLDRIYGKNSYSKFVKEAGDEPNVFSHKGKSVEELLAIWGDFVRKLQRVPVEADWLYHKVEPTADWFRKKLKVGLPEIPDKFREFAKGKKEWEDVLTLLPKSIVEKVENKDDILSEGIVSEEDIYQFLPPIISDLYKLGVLEKQATVFERKVNLAFQMLGYKVKSLGQGSGRNPDGIARDFQNHYAIIYDAKVRKDGYGFGTDDRPIIEYIKAYKNNLLKEGYEKIYFLIISNKFNVCSKTTLNRIIKATGIPVILLKTEELLSLVSWKIKNPIRFDLEALQEIFIESGELGQKVKEFISKLSSKQ